MAFAHTEPSANSSVLHTYKDSQTEARRKTDNIGCNGPTGRLSLFVDRLIQSITQMQESYLKDTTDFINFIEKTNLPKNIILVSMDVTSLYTRTSRKRKGYSLYAKHTKNSTTRTLPSQRGSLGKCSA